MKLTPEHYHEELIGRLTAAMQEADALFAREMGYTPQDVQTCLLPLLAKHGVHIELTCLPDQHRWKSQRMGGHPADAESYEWVTYCEDCGAEQI